ncbi:hypothetical protein D3C71_2158320 [compost metagenome]
MSSLSLESSLIESTAVRGSNQSQIPPPHITTLSVSSIPGYIPFKTLEVISGLAAGIPKGTTDIK